LNVKKKHDLSNDPTDCTLKGGLVKIMKHALNQNNFICNNIFSFKV